MSGKYDDIIHLPHHVSSRHPQMPMHDRAAQFSPFAALTGHDATVRETARLTDTRAELSEDEKAILDSKQRILTDNLACHPVVTVTYFVPDERKQGGAYLSVSGHLRDIDVQRRILMLSDGECIPFDSITDLDSSIFSSALL